MNYPRMYSLSTVGVLKHYVHDYLFHPVRTDFIGPNGVGKSVIADLLQLLFVYDSDLIEFGTDAVKNEKRSIYTLPYDVGLAYCFLNVEVKKGQFLVLGIALSAQSGTRIVPFVLLKQPETHLSITELALTQQEIPWANDFLTGSRTIADLKTQAAGLKEKGIYLKTFRSKDEVRQYYQFLFDKEVLSINLSVDSNLKAFARVIQSFSKAKSLNLSSSVASKNLKEFLFEDSDKDLISDYEQQQTALEKILREYNRLNIDIKLLEEKQKQLLEVRTLGEDFQTVEKVFLIAEISELHEELKTISGQESAGRNALKILEGLQKVYDQKQGKLPRIERLLVDAVREATDQVDLYVRYEELSTAIEKLEEEINDLQTMKPVVPDPDWGNHIRPIDMNLRSVETIRELAAFAFRLLSKYPTFDGIESAWRKQDQEQQLFSRGLNQVREFNIRLLELLTDGSQESLIHWLATQPFELTPEQKSAVLYFAATPIRQPEAAAGDRFVDPVKLFGNFEATLDPGGQGFWLRLGALSQFINYDALAADISFTAEDILNIKTAENELLGSQLAELEKFKKGLKYDPVLLGKNFDPDLINYTTIERLKEAVACILNLEKKVGAQKIARGLLLAELEELLEKVPVSNEMIEPAEFKRRLKVRRQQQLDRKDRVTKFAVELAGNSKNNQKEISTYNEQLILLAQNAIAKK